VKTRVAVLGVVPALALLFAVGFAQGGQQQPGNAPLFAPVDKASFQVVSPGLSKSVVWGDQGKGPYGAFTKFEPDFDAGVHAHTNDIWIVVIQGAYLYSDDAGEKRVEPGDFLRIPGGRKHRSGGDKKWGALFYEESNGKFDLMPVK